MMHNLPPVRGYNSAPSRKWLDMSYTDTQCGLKKVRDWWTRVAQQKIKVINMDILWWIPTRYTLSHRPTPTVFQSGCDPSWWHCGCDMCVVWSSPSSKITAFVMAGTHCNTGWKRRKFVVSLGCMRPPLPPGTHPSLKPPGKHTGLNFQNWVHLDTE